MRARSISRSTKLVIWALPSQPSFISSEMRKPCAGRPLKDPSISKHTAPYFWLVREPDGWFSGNDQVLRMRRQPERNFSCHNTSPTILLLDVSWEIGRAHV